MDVRNTFNSIFQTFIFQELQFCIGTLDQLFPFVHWFYAHPFPLYLLEVFRHGDLIVISFEFDTRLGNILGKMLFALVHFHIFCPIVVTHLTLYFSFVGRWYAHSWSYLRCVTYFFAIIRGVWSIRIFSVIDKMCSLVSTRVSPVYITSSRFFCTWIRFSYYRCSNGFFAICGVLRIKGTLGRP